MKLKCFLVFIVLFCFCVSGCRLKRNKIAAAGTPLTIAIAADIHFLSPALTDNGEKFMKMMEYGDGKLTMYASEITDAFLAEIADKKPDALIFNGDLTFNGEKQSHLDLADKLCALEKEGIAVLALPGNHDVNYPFAYRYEGDTATTAARTTAEDFETIYRRFGYQDAVSRDENSLSYLYALAEDVWILLLDANAGTTPEMISSSTIEWMKAQLETARRNNITVISVTHQNVLAQNPLFTDGFTIRNGSQIAGILRDYGVILNVSGHIHAQHIAEESGLTDIAASSLAVFPNQYGILSIDKKRNLSYQAAAADISGWALRQGQTKQELLIFSLTAKDYFDTCTQRKIAGDLSALPLTFEQKAVMIKFAQDVNRYYFSGTLSEHQEELVSSEGFKLWKTEGKSLFFGVYMDSILSEKWEDQRNWDSAPRPETS